MQIIHAYWEKRNIGVDCQELNIDAGDSVAQIGAALGELKAEYQVARVPAGMTDALFYLQDNGFRVVEMNIQFEKKLIEKPVLPEQYRRFEKHIAYHPADKEEIENTLKIIETGNIFITDKVACDPFFSPKHAGRRYALWAKDLIDRGSRLYICTYKGETVGFNMNTNKGEYFDAFLGGMLPEAKKSGLGFLPLFANLSTIYEQGGRWMKTGVSSNNMPIIKLHEAFGCSISGMSYILIKHIHG